MNRQQRYESVPQRDEVIILDSINSPNYNYNTAIPNSVASSSHGGRAPSMVSVPNSPPPSFHTHSSPGTPRPTPATTSATASQQYAELWGVAPSTVGGETISTSNDALATIASLKQRVEWLEESIGKLLLEKENPPSDPQHHNDVNNCCVTFADASPDLERAISGRQNCCVTFQGAKSPADKKFAQENVIRVTLTVSFLLVCGMVTLIFLSKYHNQSAAAAAHMPGGK